MSTDSMSLSLLAATQELQYLSKYSRQITRVGVSKHGSGLTQRFREFKL